jgi:predicted component of type VI protein secretion system
VEITGQADDVPLGDLPVRMLRLKTGEEVPVALEALLPERRAQELSRCGIVTLLCRRDGDQAFLASAPAVYRAAADRGDTRTGAEARRESLPFAMFVAQVSAALVQIHDRSRGGPDELAPALQRWSATREGPVIEVRAAGDSLSITPWRDPVRGLPGFTLPLSALR